MSKEVKWATSAKIMINLKTKRLTKFVMVLKSGTEAMYKYMAPEGG